MNPLVIQHTDCDICGAKAGQDCIELSPGIESHGDRLDTFCHSAPYEARLQLHLETFEYLKEEHGIADPRIGCICLSDEELDAFYGSGKQKPRSESWKHYKE